MNVAYTSVFWKKCNQLPYETVFFVYTSTLETTKKSVKNHKRRNVTDHIVRYFSALCFLESQKQRREVDEIVCSFGRNVISCLTKRRYNTLP